jgi:probable phosphoglycerate mutase
MRRRIYLMRHGAVAYFTPEGRALRPEDVPLTGDGQAQALAAASVLEGVRLDRVLSSGLPRTVHTARLVSGREPERWHELREIESGRLDRYTEEELERLFAMSFHGVVGPEVRFLGGETVGELFDRVLPALDRLLADESWDTVLAVLHGAVNRAIISWALTGERKLLGALEQSPGCLNVLDVGPTGWVVRAVNVSPLDLHHAATRLTTMEELWEESKAFRDRIYRNR